MIVKKKQELTQGQVIHQSFFSIGALLLMTVISVPFAFWGVLSLYHFFYGFPTAQIAAFNPKFLLVFGISLMIVGIACHYAYRKMRTLHALLEQWQMRRDNTISHFVDA